MAIGINLNDDFSYPGLRGITEPELIYDQTLTLKDFIIEAHHLSIKTVDKVELAVRFRATAVEMPLIIESIKSSIEKALY